MKANKYTYYKVIQEYVGGMWNDVDFHETDSTYFGKTKKDMEYFKQNLKLYRSESSYPIRTVRRRELN